MTTKKPEPEAEYDFRAGVRGKHHRAVPTAPSSGQPAPAVRQQPTRKPEDRVPKLVKR